jgi:hypothetical protein
MEKLELDFCLKHQIPLVNQTNAERLQNLLAYRNDRKLFRRICDQSQETLISAYHPLSDFKIIKSEIWWGDSWEGLQFGFVPDFTSCFFEQFSKLQKLVPREGTSVVNSENCSYNSHTRESKNCYLSHLAFKSEDLHYCFWTTLSQNLIDCSYSRECSLCYDCSYITNCYQCVRIEESSNCVDCLFSFQLTNCKNCLLCSNLNHKEFHYLNKPCSKELYFQKLAEVQKNKESYLLASRKLSELQKNSVVRAIHSINCEDVSGEHLNNCSNSYHCFDLVNSQDCYNSTNGGGKDLIHTYSAGFPECEEVYCSVTLRSCTRIFFSNNCWSSYNLWYCDSCVNCKDCFACVGLKHKQNCFFNKQYTATEYETVVASWKKKMLKDKTLGLFFPIKYSPLAYNESAAQDFYPLSKAGILEHGYQWRDPQAILSSSEASSPNVTLCKECRSPYRITPVESKFYLSFHLFVPEICPDCRIFKRIERRNSYQLLDRECGKCGVEIESAYEKNAFPLMYCDDCFRDEFFS